MDTKEYRAQTVTGWLALAALIVAGALITAAFCYAIDSYQGRRGNGWMLFVPLSLIACGYLVLWGGFFTLQPNIAGALTLFGKYRGTVFQTGFHWINPLMSVNKVSLRARNLNGERIKVNDHRGSPIEIAAILVWRVTDTACALFDVESYESFVTIQSEAALRHLAMAYSYDTFEGDTLSLRGSVDEVSAALKKEVQEKVRRAGVLIEDARLSHLAYAPEIAGAMLQRQQAEAVVAARSRIVDGAVGMVEMALAKLDQHATIKLDDERRAAMVSNLLVVLCAHEPAQPIVNTGTLYQ